MVCPFCPNLDPEHQVLCLISILSPCEAWIIEFCWFMRLFVCTQQNIVASKTWLTPNSVVSTQASVACNVDNVVYMLSLEDQFCVSNRVSFSLKRHGSHFSRTLLSTLLTSAAPSLLTSANLKPKKPLLSTLFFASQQLFKFSFPSLCLSHSVSNPLRNLFFIIFILFAFLNS